MIYDHTLQKKPSMSSNKGLAPMWLPRSRCPHLSHKTTTQMDRNQSGKFIDLDGWILKHDC